MRNRGVTSWAWAAALAGVAAAGGPARAFYWYGPPEKTVISPPDRDKPGNPPGPGGGPNPPEGPSTQPPAEVPREVKSESPPGPYVPEPATLAGALAGLGTVAAGRAWRRKR